MKAYDGFSAKKDLGSGRIPAGNYVGVIKSAKCERNDWGEYLVLAFDISEGDYKGFFQTQFDNQDGDEKKWKGTCRIRVPEPGHQYFTAQKRTFENAIYCIEHSNSGYHWDWDEKKLKGKTAGFRSRDKEFTNTLGEAIMYTEFLDLAIADEVRDGTAKRLKPKLLSDEVKATTIGASAPASPANGSFEIVSDDDDLPF